MKEKSKVAEVIIRTISDPKARSTQELQAGNIDGYDLVAPGDQQSLKDGGFQILNRRRSTSYTWHEPEGEGTI